MPNLTKHKIETKLITGTIGRFKDDLQEAIDEGFMYMNDLSTCAVDKSDVVYSAVVTKMTIVN